MRSSIPCLILPLLACLLGGPALMAAEQLDDAAVAGKVKDIIGQLQQAVQGKLEPGQKLDPALVAKQFSDLNSVIASAADPKGENTLLARIVIAQIFDLEGQYPKAEQAYQAIGKDGGTAKPALESWALLAQLYQKLHRLDDIDALVAAAKQQKLDPDLVSEMSSMVESERKAAVGSPFGDFTLTDTAGVVHKLADYKGKVLMIDFWATWCGPCVGELPNVKKIYDTYHSQGFEILGVSLDQSREKLDAFLQQKGITWPQYFDGKGWQNDFSSKYMIQSIPATFLIGRDGVLIDKGLRGEELEAAVKTALAGPAAKPAAK